VSNISGYEVTALGNSFEEDGLSLTSGFRITDRILDGLDVGGDGLVVFEHNSIFVSSPGNNIQRAIDSAIPGFTVQVEAGIEGGLAVNKPLSIAFADGSTLDYFAHDGVLDLVITGTPEADAIVLAAGTGGEVVVSMNGLPAISFAVTGQIIAYGGATFNGGAGSDQIVAGIGSSVIAIEDANDQLIDDDGSITQLKSMPPQVFNDSYTITAQGHLVVPASGVLSNDASGDGAALTSELVVRPEHGTLIFNDDGSFQFTADDYVGEVMFSYRAVRPDGTASSLATATIRVTPIPSVSADLAVVSIVEGQSATNSGAFADLGTTGAVTLSASIGSVTPSALDSGTWIWTIEDTNGLGNETVIITATDRQGAVSSASFVLRVRPVNPPPSQLSGRVFNDLNNDGRLNIDDVGLEQVALQLFDESDLVNPVATTTTDIHGYYVFTGLEPARYRIVAAQPVAFLDGKETDGNLGGTVNNAEDSNTIADIELFPGEVGLDYNFAEIRPSRLQAMVWEDFNNDGEVNFGEKAIAGVEIRVTGTDDRSRAVDLALMTDGDGIAEFLKLRPGKYSLSETQPANYPDGKDVRGTVNGVPSGEVMNDLFSDVVLTNPGSEGVNYNFAERAPSSGAISGGQTAGIGFWQNNNGQNLIKALNGGPSATQLGNWLAATFPNMYGLGAGVNNLVGKTNAEVAGYYQLLFSRTGSTAEGGGPPKMEAQVLATALAVYVTNATLGGNTATAYNFVVSQYGVGTATYNVGTKGAAFGLANYSTTTVLNLLLAVNSRSKAGRLYDLDGDGDADDSLETSFRTLAYDLFKDINEF
jgi:hypothetical protein